MRFERLARRYRGETAREYEERRASSPKWLAEQDAMDRLLGGLPSGATVLDIPVGTARFAELYGRHEVRPTGMDISVDMLELAEAKLKRLQLRMPLALANIRNIPVPNGSFEGGVCVRLLNWLNASSLDLTLAELCRVVRRHMIIGIRYYTPLTKLTRRVYRPRNLKRILFQLWARVSHQHGLVIHEKSYIDTIFRRRKLRVLDCEWIESRGDGTEYVIYHLVKREGE